jgi:UDP-glucose 4-epimerase
MTEKKVILITGVANYWGAQVATRLIEATDTSGRPVFHVVGLDAEPPEAEIKELDFIQADIRNPLLVNLLQSEEVDTVCHLTFEERTNPSEATFDVNVMGTMKVLGACAEAGVRKVVLKSSTAVYGANPQNPAFITEEHPLQGSRVYGYTRDLVEIEAFCNGFRRQVPEMILTVLRFPSIIGLRVDTPMTRFLKETLAPTLWGFDPLMQVIHEKDVVESLLYVVVNDFPGVFNVAADGILPLSRLTALAAKPPLPVFHLWAYWGKGLMKSVGLRAGHYFPIELDYIRYPWVVDLVKMRGELRFMPHYTAEEALREFAGDQRLRRYTPEASSLVYDEERLRDTIERRRREKEFSAKQAAAKVEEERHE